MLRLQKTNSSQFVKFVSLKPCLNLESLNLKIRSQQIKFCRASSGRLASGFLALAVWPALGLHASTLAMVNGVEVQPLAAQVRRVVETLDYLGAPLSAEEKRLLGEASANGDSAAAGATFQRVLDAHCLVGLTINPEMRVEAAPGAANAELVAQGWRTFLVKVRNDAGTTAELRAVSPQAQSVHDSPAERTDSDKYYRKNEPAAASLPGAQRWLDMELFDKQPLQKALSGLNLEYPRHLALQPRCRTSRGPVAV